MCHVTYTCGLKKIRAYKVSGTKFVFIDCKNLRQEDPERFEEVELLVPVYKIRQWNSELNGGQ